MFLFNICFFEYSCSSAVTISNRIEFMVLFSQLEGISNVALLLSLILHASTVLSLLYLVVQLNIIIIPCGATEYHHHTLWCNWISSLYLVVQLNIIIPIPGQFNKASIAKFCPLKNICRMCIHAQRASDMEEQMSSALHSRDQLEAINAQLQQQNKLLQEQVALLRQQVNQAQAPGTPSPSPRV